MISIWWLFSHCCSWSCIPRDWRKVSQQRSQATLFLSVTNLFVTTSSRPWNLDTFENGSHNKRPRRESENRFWKKYLFESESEKRFWKNTIVKVKVMNAARRHFCPNQGELHCNCCSNCNCWSRKERDCIDWSNGPYLPSNCGRYSEREKSIPLLEPLKSLKVKILRCVFF